LGNYPKSINASSLNDWFNSEKEDPVLIDVREQSELELARFSKEEIEKFCWMAVHEHKHGVLPSEYDIREIDEDLYLELLREFKSNIY